MKRVRLDIGQVIKESGKDGKFVFSLSKRNSNEAIRVSLTPAQMHTILSNLNHIAEDGVTTQHLLFESLTNFMIEVLEVVIVRNNHNDNFESNLLLFDGDKEVTIKSSVVDGVILAKKFACPIYISEELMEKYGEESAHIEIADSDSYTDELKIQLKLAIDNEDYEKASILSKEIFKNEQDKKLIN